MRKILFFIFVTSYSVFADALPKSIKSSIKEVSNNTVKLANTVPAGMSGIIIHDYGNGLQAITHSTISLGDGKASILKNKAILHPNIPGIQTAVSIGDSVVFGNFYQNALLIAPNQTIYRQITKKFKRTWTHPDMFALDFMEEGETQLSMEALERFSQKNQIGLVLVVTSDKLLVIDPISHKIIGNTTIKINETSAMSPFYARFKQMDLSIFELSEKTYTPYFKSVAGLK